MDIDLLTQESNTIPVFEKWMVNVNNMIVDLYFVYQVQPLSPNLNYKTNRVIFCNQFTNINYQNLLQIIFTD